MMQTRLPAGFYARPTLQVLTDLMGKVLVHLVRGRRVSGVIVEAEAYIGESDPACHAAPGPTRRNAPLYGPPGVAYVYLNYGLHSLVNVVTEPRGAPAAVLFRALEPSEGADLMRRRRRRTRQSTSPVPDADLCRGPGNLTVALGITLHHNRSDLTTGPLAIEDHQIRPGRLVWTPRVGIRVGAERLWRCSIHGHPSASGPRAAERSGRAAPKPRLASGAWPSRGTPS